MHHTKVEKWAKRDSIAASDPDQDAVLEMSATSKRSEEDGKRKPGSMLSRRSA